jgi:hypothetical protein
VLAASASASFFCDFVHERGRFMLGMRGVLGGSIDLYHSLYPYAIFELRVYSQPPLSHCSVIFPHIPFLLLFLYA